MKFLHYIILDNSVKSYLIVAGIIVFVFLLKRIISRLLLDVILTIINQTWKIDKQKFKKLVVKPMSWFLVIVVSVIAIDKLNYPAQWNITVYGIHLQSFINAIGTSAIIISFFRFLVRMVDFIALMLSSGVNTSGKSEYQMMRFFGDFLKIVITFIGFLAVIHWGFKKPIGPLLTGLSIVGAALALAAKESLENLIASFIILFDKPFFVGDLLKINNITGTVERIGMRSTRIRTVDKTLVTIPNKQMVDGVVDNLSMRTQWRGEMKLEFAMDTNTHHLEQLIHFIHQELKSRQDQIERYSTFLQTLDKNGLMLWIEYHTEPADFLGFSQLRHDLIKIFREKINELKLPMQSTSAEIKISKKEGADSF